jgi:hypothetical protein
MLLLYGMVVANSGSLLPLADFTELLDSLRGTWRTTP